MNNITQLYKAEKQLNFKELTVLIKNNVPPPNHCFISLPGLSLHL